MEVSVPLKIRENLMVPDRALGYLNSTGRERPEEDLYINNMPLEEYLHIRISTDDSEAK